jgi:hypothetical protein
MIEMIPRGDLHYLGNLGILDSKSTTFVQYGRSHD